MPANNWLLCPHRNLLLIISAGLPRRKEHRGYLLGMMLAFPEALILKCRFFTWWRLMRWWPMAPRVRGLRQTSVGPKIILKNLPLVNWLHCGSAHYSLSCITVANAATVGTALQISLCSRSLSDRLNG